MQGFLLCENGKGIEITDEDRLSKALKKNKVDIVIDSGFGGNIPSTVIDTCQEPPLVTRSGAGEFN